MTTELSWILSPRASALHTAAAMLDGARLVDHRLSAALESEVRILGDELATLGINPPQFFGHLIPASVRFDVPRKSVEATLTKLFGSAARDDELAERLARRLGKLQAAFDQAVPRASEELELRSVPLREQWESRGGGLLAAVARVTEADLIVEEAEVILALPVQGGGGAAHWPYNAARIEAVLANPIAELPEVARLGWLVAQLNLDLPRFQGELRRERLAEIGPLAMMPAVLTAAREVELADYSPLTLGLAIRAWGSAIVEPSKLIGWWDAYRSSEAPWTVALARWIAYCPPQPPEKCTVTNPRTSEHETPLPLRYRLRRAAGPLFALAAFAAAGWLLSRQLHRYDYRDIRHALTAIPSVRLLVALLLTIGSYLVLIGYDYLAVRFLNYPLSLGRIALVSFIGHVSSYNFGAVLGGASVRYRLYSAWGLSAVEVVKVITLSTATFWSGYLLLAGIIFIADPVVLPPELHAPFRTVAPVGMVLLGLVVAYLAMCALGRRRPLRFRGWEFPIPSLSLALGQIAVSAVDLAASGGTLYALLPPDVAITYGHFLTIYLIAVVAVLFTHVPGGLGILEVVVLLLLAPDDPAAVMGSLLAFRAIYYLLPLLVAAALLAGYEAALRRRAIERMAGAVGRWAPGVVPRFLSFLTLVAGSLLLFSGALPESHSRLAWWSEYLPLAVLEFAHFMSSITGVMLLLLAYGLQRRLNSAYWASAVALVAGVVFSIFKGFDTIELVVLVAVVAVLGPCRSFFYRRTSLIEEHYTPEWMAVVAAVLLAAVWLSLFAFKHVEFSNELWVRFSLRADAPRILRAGVGVATVLVLFGVAHVFRHPEPKPHWPTAGEILTVRAIVSASPRTVANLALSGDKHLLVNDARTALVMYAVRQRSWVSYGDPIGPTREQPELIWSFRELVEHYGGWPVFYQVYADLLPVYLDLGLTLLKVGEEARVSLPDFDLQAPARHALAESAARAQQAGYQFEILEAEGVSDQLPALADVSRSHLIAGGMPECRFAYGPFDDTYLRQFPMAVLRHEGRVLAFANVWTGAGREELAADLLRYRPEASDIARDFLLIELMRWGQRQGYQWFNLGVAPLAETEGPESSGAALHYEALVSHYSDYFYPQRGLRQLHERFAPVWTLKYLAAPGGLALPRILANIAELISGAAPRKPPKHL